DQQRRDNQKNIIVKNKKAVLKLYQDALEKSTADNLLDAPAIVSAPFHTAENAPVFSTEEEGGTMLVTENPEYFRKDLPKDVPQFMVINWQWGTSIPDETL